MRISDWSSDVCSSDLLPQRHSLAPTGNTGAPTKATMGYPWRSSRYQDWGRLCGRLVALSRLKRNHRRDVVAIVRQAQLDVVAGRTAAENTWRQQSAFAALTHDFAIADAVLCQQLPGECAP